MVDQKIATINLITYEQQKQTESMFPRQGAFLAKCSQVTCDQLKGNLAECVSALSELLEGLPETTGSFQVEQATFALNVNASGKISLIGELAAGVSSSVTLTFARKVQTDV